MRLSDRIAHLERATNHAPMLVLEVDREPTPEQAAEIDAATRSARRLLVFVAHGNTAWMPDAGPAPWSAS
jgi:hypothetical protein